MASSIKRTSRRVTAVTFLLSLVPECISLQSTTVFPNNTKWVFSSTNFPSVWFGANASGPETTAQHLIETRYRSVYFGWQQSNSATGCKHEEQALLSQLSAVRQLSPRVSTIAYASNAASALRFYDWQAGVMSNASMSGYFLPDPKPEQTMLGCSNPQSDAVTWDWRNASARDFFVDHVIASWAEEEYVDAVFVDEGDAVQCRWTQYPGLTSLSEVYRYTNGSAEVYRRAAAVLAAKGKRLILSLKNGIPGAAPIAERIGICPVQLDVFFDAMQQAPAAPFIRYHEYWGAFSSLHESPGQVAGNPIPPGNIMCKNLVRTALDETQKRGIALSAHGGSYTPSSRLDLAFALFMVVRTAQPGGHEDFFGWSTGEYWYTDDWHWNDTAAYYTHGWGNAVGPTTEPGSGMFARDYEGGRVEVDCNTLTANITMH